MTINATIIPKGPILLTGDLGEFKLMGEKWQPGGYDRQGQGGPVPLRRLGEQAVLRRDAFEDRVSGG